ncbi:MULTISPECIES: helix-turn-helix transcriptional regulator [Aerococcus]|uniref:Helix-turn-helix transcriptional regulator n=1 Tax=Aerococcus tenax TaxID=3078812 RepID=A0A5N1BM47_9LACT|nr:helix-turn-helix transcriptional regulator [Aerococcus urinae]KAA9241165.1 helix-turn-helix transcriptional regulator [Aerococcus urinae]MDK6597794.1 helix-turn-helix transcriptional regulator [Aerococcus urinae]MDK7302626.1 helix-turn-helix transcriptional regulator [Aerococcus urinae]MDK7801591.1 helix-turn-helix transcriptional regulator [Aerococcus urinae]MDK8654870.1 helix-turn-helix transcriptional regulator [Aerococcus urinae]
MNRLKYYRTRAGLSQKALAEEIGVARQTVNMIENDRYNPSLELCIALAKALDTDLNALFWEEDDDDKEE